MSMSAEARVEPTPSERIARSMIEDTSALMSPPDVCLKVNELLSDDRTQIEDIAGVVIRDPSLTTKVMRLANSAFYGLSQKVDTVSRAVMLLGMREMQKMVCAIAAVETFSKMSSALTNMNSFWRHGVYTGLVAQSLAKRARVLHPERLFVAGVMHDIGTLLINQRFPELANDIIRDANGSEDELFRLENDRFGFDHAYLAALMLENWQLPQTLVDAIRWHHLPAKATHAGVEAAILKVADTVANYSGTGSFSETVNPTDAFDASLLASYGVVVDCPNDELMDEVDRQFVETIYLLVA